MAKISELTLVTSLTGKEILPIVINNISNRKENKSITIDTLKQELITLGILDEDIIREIIFLAIEGNYVQMQDFNIAMSLKSDTTHNHDGVYSEKIHTHNYVDLKGLPNVANISPQDYVDLLNHIDQIDNEVYECMTNTDILMEAFSEMKLMGEWTPVAYVGNDILVSTESIGTYYCTGNLCFINGTITFMSGENMSQHLRIGALPFAPDHVCHCIPLGMCTGLVLDPQYKQMNAQLTENGYIELYQMVQSEWFPVSGTCVSQEGATISFSGTYIIRSI